MRRRQKGLQPLLSHWGLWPVSVLPLPSLAGGIHPYIFSVFYPQLGLPGCPRALKPAQLHPSPLLFIQPTPHQHCNGSRECLSRAVGFFEVGQWREGLEIGGHCRRRQLPGWPPWHLRKRPISWHHGPPPHLTPPGATSGGLSEERQAEKPQYSGSQGAQPDPRVSSTWRLMLGVLGRGVQGASQPLWRWSETLWRIPEPQTG